MENLQMHFEHFSNSANESSNKIPKGFRKRRELEKLKFHFQGITNEILSPILISILPSIHPENVQT